MLIHQDLHHHQALATAIAILRIRIMHQGDSLRRFNEEDSNMLNQIRADKVSLPILITAIEPFILIKDSHQINVSHQQGEIPRDSLKFSQKFKQHHFKWSFPKKNHKQGYSLRLDNDRILTIGPP
ncbi:hypothetical protein XF_0735 [Xylella fastidiosa 9a5c]|uniref:Uncharacterized protein n=1 Tax=Xylella fastidiosa (strain 9a5c) TaxID=160492 RepID=Q9PFE3_XYLFA|nr:hypothetical protein XF_0735 [Xylella fastidiosa 9a5c]